MPFSDVEVRDHEAALTPFLEKRRPPEPVRDQVDLDYRIEDQTITIFERRALWQSGGETVESPVAKIKYARKHGLWKLYWYMSDMRWHAYEPHPEAESLEEALHIVDADEHGCFWG